MVTRIKDDEDAFDERGLLKDGRRFRVPLMMRDGDSVSPMQREVMADKAMRDAAKRFGLSDALALHKPGQRFCTDAAGLDAKAEAYADSVEELTTAWQRKPSEDLSGEFRGQQPGDQCTINGQPGHLNHRLECVPDKRDSIPRRMTADEAQPIRDAAWSESVRELENAWRGPAR
jgi:hypothetical protein